ncbi:MAG: ABC transporter permease [Pseudobutyrivibrio sp.]|nr:ABC transporter permease [Pseudobutyrivibrio sp.]
MFVRIFLYKIKELTRMRSIVGWNFLFPLVLATAFYVGFGNLIKEDPDTFKTIDVGYVNTNSQDSPFSELLEELSKETDEHIQVLNVQSFKDEKSASKAMDDKKISGFYLENGDKINTVIKENGLASTTLNQIVRAYENAKFQLEEITTNHPEKIEQAIKLQSKDLNLMKEHNFGNNTSRYLQYFFALIAMSSLFSSWISTSMLNGICANISEGGKRFECAPANKLVAVAAGTLAGMLIQSVSNAIVVIYIQYVLNINIGIPLGETILITTIGSGIGIAAGTLIGSLLPNPKYHVVVPLLFSMTCSFFSGLMWDQIKQLIQYKCPIINKINPAALITDSLFIRATYGRTDTYIQNIIIMLSMIVGCLFISSICLRRRKYVSL